MHALAAAIATCAAAVVSVEEGGVAVLPCGSASPNCTISVDKKALTAFFDWQDRTGPASRVNETHCSCELPPADAEAQVYVSFGAAAAGSVRYEALLAAQVALRPILSTDNQTGLAVKVHRSLASPCVEARLRAAQLLPAPPPPCVPVVPGAETLLSVPLQPWGSLATEEDLNVTLRWQANGGNWSALSKTVPLARVLPPLAGSFVQVDHARKSFRVNGTPTGVLVGYYDSQSVSLQNFTRLSKLGINWGMRYLGNVTDPAARQPANFTRDMLDWSHAAGLHAVLDIFETYEVLAGVVTDPRGIWDATVAEITRYRSHPGLFGYYVCDDCLTHLLGAQRKAGTPYIDGLYKAIKQVDPYHPIFGAVEGVSLDYFTTSSYLVPGGRSLDVPMGENYPVYLEAVAQPASAEHGWGSYPLTWEAVVNIPGVVNFVKRRPDLTDDARVRNIYSGQWLSAVLANAPHQLHFRLGLHPTIYERFVVEAVGRYAALTAKLTDWLLAPPSGVPEPYLAPVGPTAAGTAAVARLWRRASPLFSAVIAVVNPLNISVTAQFALHGADAWPGAQSARFCRADGGSGDAPVSEGVLAFTVDAYDSQVFWTECTQSIPSPSRPAVFVYK